MNKVDVMLQGDVDNCYNNKNDLSNHPVDISLDNNNNETPEHKFCAGKRYDSGLGILSPQSEESFTNIFPNTYTDYVDNCFSTVNTPDIQKTGVILDKKLNSLFTKNETNYNKVTLPNISPNSCDDNFDNCYSTINIPNIPKTEINVEKKWNSLFVKNEDTRDVADLAEGVIELKTMDSNNNMATSILIYRNDKKQFRHINIIDYRPKYKSKVRRSNTFSNDKNNKYSSPNRDMCRSTDNLTFAQSSLSTYDLCNNLSHGSSSSIKNTQIVNRVNSLQKESPRSCCKMIREMISNICCRKNPPISEISEEEIPTFENYSDWKFSLDEFDDLTYYSSGAQGTIYTAIYKDTKVALKHIKDNLRKDDIDIEHLMALNHTNIITFIGVCEESPNYLIMEFCSQGQLFDWLHRDVQISSFDICSWALQICDGMAYLHKKDIIHRDLKSPNVLINEQLVLKIIDFEFSKDCCESKILNSFVGTMAWMAPEVLREEVHTKKVDVWSHGVVIWEMITREIPYCGIERLSILFGVGSNTLSLPLCTSIPIEIKELLSKCWEQCPDKRPSFQDILDNFTHYFGQLERYSQEEFTSKQLEWKEEIELKFQELNKEKISTSKLEAELVRRRNNELTDAKKIKELYNEKLKRADKLIALLNKCLNAVEDERKKNDSEWKLIQKIKQSTFSNTANKNDQGTLISLQLQNGIKNLRLKNDKSNRIPSPNNLPKKERSMYRHSMLEQPKFVEKGNKVRRKHSVPSCREKPYFPGTRTKLDLELNTKDRKLTKIRTKKTSLSLEMVANDSRIISSHNENNCKKSEIRWKRNSSPCRNVGFSNLPSPSKTCLQVDDVSGIINPSFQGSCESFTNIRELKRANSNLLHIGCFGASASICDINNSSDNMTDSLNTGPSQSLFQHSLLEESIYECPHGEEINNMEEINEDIHEDENNRLVIIRGTSGRSKASGQDSSLKDSLDVSMITAESLTPYSLIEKENIAQNLIKPFGFLAHMNGDTCRSSKSVHSTHRTIERDSSTAENSSGKKTTVND